jgi:hypothetical protein
MMPEVLPVPVSKRLIQLVCSSSIVRRAVST